MLIMSRTFDVSNQEKPDMVLKLNDEQFKELYRMLKDFNDRYTLNDEHSIRSYRLFEDFDNIWYHDFELDEEKVKAFYNENNVVSTQDQK